MIEIKFTLSERTQLLYASHRNHNALYQRAYICILVYNNCICRSEN